MKTHALLALVATLSSAMAAPPEIPPAVRQLGQETAQALGTNLLTQLQSKVGAGDFPGAIEACTRLAPEIAAQVKATRPEVLSVGRVTKKPRNPANRAGDADAAVLSAYAAGETPLEPRWMVESDRYTLYKPLQIQPLCLGCHGDKAQMTPAVREKLAILYPKDEATGYTNGAFRGAIKVSIRR